MSGTLVARTAAVLAFVVALLPVGMSPAAGAAEDAIVGLQEETFTVGPFTLAPEGQPGDQVDQRFVPMPRPAGDLAVRTITWALVDAEGDPVAVDDAHLHHIVLMDTSRRDALCSFPSAARFAASGMELNDLSLPDPYAYLSPAGGAWQGIYHVMNTSDVAREVSIQYTIGWTAPGDDLRDVDLHFFDVTGCWGTSEFTVPGGGGPGSVHEESNEYSMTRSGEMVVGGGHLHRHGIDVTLDGPDGEVCRSVATYGGGVDPHHGHLEVSPCGVMDEQFEPGDRYRLTARYDNEHEVAGAMGIMGVYVHFTSPPPPPPPPVTIELTVGTLAGGALTGTIRCSRPVQAFVSGDVEQQKGSTRPVYGYGYGDVEDCGPVATTFSLPLHGSGVLTGGDVQVRLAGYSYDEQMGESSSTQIESQLRVSGRSDLGAPPPDTGTLPISIDRRATEVDGRHVVSGTVTCDEPQRLYLGIGGHQRVGRHHVWFGGGEEVLDCDGPTAFSTQISASDGRLAGGPATVTVWAYPTETGDFTQVSSTVSLPGGRLEPPAPDPSSPLRVDAVRSTAAGPEAVVTMRGCPAGADLYLEVQTRPASGGKRIGGDVAGGWESTTCTGGDQTLVVPLFGTLPNRRATVDVSAYVGDETGYDVHRITASVPVTSR